jgi:hypothetical protein
VRSIPFALACNVSSLISPEIDPTETQDWIVGVQADGSVLFWKVKGLGVPKQAPVANLYSVLVRQLRSYAESGY